MAVASSTAALLGAAVTFASTAVGTWSAVSRQEEQRKQAEFSADMARRNAQIAEENARMAEEEARQTRADSYDKAVRKRQETSLLAGASGAQIDSGSHLDSQLDLREKGELDALSIEEQGERAAYNQEVQAWNQRNAAQGSQARERQLRSKSSTDYLSLSKTLLNGAGRLGNNFDLFSGQGPRLP